MPTVNRSATLALIILVGITLAATALAQVDTPAEGVARTDDPLALTPVDQGTADLGGLNTSNRLIPVDLRQPLDFRGLYRAPDQSGRLMRVSGGLSAVFSRSEYAASAGFIFPVIPAGTEYFIGPMRVTTPAFTPPESPAQGQAAHGPSNGPDAGFGFIDGRLSLSANGMTSNRLDGANPPAIRRIHASNAPTAPATGAPRDQGITLDGLLTGRVGLETPETPLRPSIWSSERYRRGRVATLLAMAHEHRRGS